MKLTIDLDDQALEAIANAVATRLRATRSADEWVGARDLGVSRRTWRAAVKRGELRAKLVGREYLARRGDAEAWLRSRPDVRTAGAQQADTSPTTDVDAAIAQLLEGGRLRALPGGGKDE